MSAGDLRLGRRLGWRILDHKVVEPVRNPGSVDRLAFGSVVNIPAILVLPVDQITTSLWHLFDSYFWEIITRLILVWVGCVTLKLLDFQDARKTDVLAALQVQS